MELAPTQSSEDASCESSQSQLEAALSSSSSMMGLPHVPSAHSLISASIHNHAAERPSIPNHVSDQQRRSGDQDSADSRRADDSFDGMTSRYGSSEESIRTTHAALLDGPDRSK
eukprot:FR744302.1.p1 GENE.FR744302.1~~FR744302.1.p1  ORF type:complete len:114 (+),score=4.72 FR744302.1:367-708(+)